MARRLQACLLALLALSATASSGRTGGSWADVGVLEQRENATVALLVINRAPSDVTLANCAEQHAVRAGGNVTLALTGLTGFWVVPDGVQWECHKGPFNLFTLAANFTGPDLVAAVGYGLPDAHFPSLEGSAEQQAAMDQPGLNWTDKVAGVELGAGADATVRCRAAGCTQGYNVTSVPNELILSIMGPQASILSFWYGGNGDGDDNRVSQGGAWQQGGGGGGGAWQGGSGSQGSWQGGGGGGSQGGWQGGGGGGSQGGWQGGGGSQGGWQGGGGGGRGGCSGDGDADDCGRGGGGWRGGGGGGWHGGWHHGGRCMYWCRWGCYC